MDDLVIHIEKIEKWFMDADFHQTYKAFFVLCEPHSDFKDSAQMILSDFNDFCKNVERGIVPLSEQHIHKREIAGRFQMCMNRFKDRHINACPVCCVYEEEASCLKEHINRIRKTELKITTEYLECEDKKKIGILKKILQEITSVLKRFDNLLKYFTEVRNYERI